MKSLTCTELNTTRGDPSSKVMNILQTAREHRLLFDADDIENLGEQRAHHFSVDSSCLPLSIVVFHNWCPFLCDGGPCLMGTHTCNLLIGLPGQQPALSPSQDGVKAPVETWGSSRRTSPEPSRRAIFLQP